MCVPYGHVDAVLKMWDGLLASGGLPVGSRHLAENWCPLGIGWCMCGRGLAPPFRSIEDFRL